MDIYEPFQQISMWGDSFKVDGGLNSIASPVLLVNTSMETKSEYTPHEPREASGNDQVTTNKDVSKVLRRLAQNREAAKKSRQRKKAYVQQLETSRLKLMQLEQEIGKARKQAKFRAEEAKQAALETERKAAMEAEKRAAAEAERRAEKEVIENGLLVHVLISLYIVSSAWFSSSIGY